MFNTLFNTKLKKEKKKTKFFQATPFGLLCALFFVLEREKYH